MPLAKDTASVSLFSFGRRERFYTFVHIIVAVLIHRTNQPTRPLPLIRLTLKEPLCRACLKVTTAARRQSGTQRRKKRALQTDGQPSSASASGYLAMAAIVPVAAAAAPALAAVTITATKSIIIIINRGTTEQA